MTRIYVQNIRTQDAGIVDFKDIISVNGASQWLDTYGVIKANKITIDESVTIPSGTNGLTVGTITVGAGYNVTVQGECSIV